MRSGYAEVPSVRKRYGANSPDAPPKGGLFRGIYLPAMPPSPGLASPLFVSAVGALAFSVFVAFALRAVRNHLGPWNPEARLDRFHVEGPPGPFPAPAG